MKNQITARQRYLYAVAAIIFVAGLGSAALIYLMAGDNQVNELIQGFENSKRYVHDLEVYGGKMNVLMDQFMRWFESLWRGKALAGSVAVITIVLALGLALVAHNLPPDSRSGKKSG